MSLGSPHWKVVYLLLPRFHLDDYVRSSVSALPRLSWINRVIYLHLLLSPSRFQNSLSTFSIERVNGIPLWDFYPNDFQRALKIIIIAELFIVMTISPGY